MIQFYLVYGIPDGIDYVKTTSIIEHNQCLLFAITKAAYELCKEQHITIDFCLLHHELHSKIETFVATGRRIPILFPKIEENHIDIIVSIEEKEKKNWNEDLKDISKCENLYITPHTGKKGKSCSQISHVISKSPRDELRCFVIFSNGDIKNIGQVIDCTGKCYEVQAYEVSKASPHSYLGNRRWHFLIPVFFVIIAAGLCFPRICF